SRKGGMCHVEDYNIDSFKTDAATSTATGTVLYDEDGLFMPVTIGGLKIPFAVMTISGKKTIVETALVGAKGTVKELVSVDDYAITIAGMLYNGTMYPELEISRFMELYLTNESVSLVSAFSDVVFNYGSDKVVIKSVSFPPMGGCEEMQAVKIECVSDAPYELIIS
ncbi:MAG: DUF6046 domain-containing protein, partial [Rikenellaceae bacterium]